MKKIMMIVTILVAGVMLIPNVFAYSAGTYGTVTDVTSSDSRIEGTADLQTSGNTTYMKYASSSFNFVDSGSSAAGERPGNAAWVGMKVDYPTSVTNSSYDVYIDGEKYEGGEKGTNYYTEYFGITAEKLENAIKEGTPLEYKVEFDWDKSGKADQVVIIQIDPMTVEVYKDHDKSETIWTEEMAEEALAKYHPIVAEPEKTPAEKQETNPDTADMNLLGLLALVLTCGLGITYSVKKARRN